MTTPSHNNAPEMPETSPETPEVQESDAAQAEVIHLDEPFRVKQAEFITSAPTLAHAPELGGIPELVMVGRSNVGKSSFINGMTGRKNIAKTSNTPGKTRLINFYRINNALAMVDLPGYGYAKVSKKEQQHWQKHLESYLLKREELVLVIQLIDSRHGMQANDFQMWQWLQHHGLPTLLVLTKTDKTKQQDVFKHRRELAARCGCKPDDILLFSAIDHGDRSPAWQQVLCKAFEPVQHSD